jgi:hypothetical protein
VGILCQIVPGSADHETDAACGCSRDATTDSGQPSLNGFVTSSGSSDRCRPTAVHCSSQILLHMDREVGWAEMKDEIGAMRLLITQLGSHSSFAK